MRLRFYGVNFMDSVKLNLGDKIKLQLYDDSDVTLSSQELPSQYENSLPDGSMEIVAPIKEGRVVPVHRGVEMDVMFAQNGNMYTFKAETIGRRVTGNLYLLRIKPKTKIVKLQRRLYFRLECVLDVKNRFFENMDDKDSIEYRDAITKNISGGGLCLLTDVEPKEGSFFDGIIDIGGEINFKGKVVRVNELENQGKYRFEVGIEFTDITEQEREKVISFIFDTQRKKLKKGWLTT